jgi:DNA-binding LacI/PurR family transcriptional regulator
LIQQGHVNILFIGGPLHISSGRERLQGFRNAHKKAGLPIKENLIRITRITAGASGEAVKQALTEKVPFTAILAFSDLMAYEILCTLRIQNENQQAAMVGFDNIQGKLMLPVSLPSVDSHGDEASLAVELLMKRIREPTEKPSHIVLDVELKMPPAALLFTGY